MESETQLNTKIMNITMLIQEKYPELVPYLSEMPVTIPIEKNPEINVENLHKYYNSLTEMLSKYLLEHPELQS